VLRRIATWPVTRLRAFVGPRLKPRWPLFFPFPDGRWRLGTVRLYSLTRLWCADIPELREESNAVLPEYKGGDLVDVGAFHGWYSALLAGKVSSPAKFLSIEPDRRAHGALQANLRTIGRRFPRMSSILVTEGVGDGRALEPVWPMGPDGHPSFTVREGGNGRGLTVDALVQEHGLAPGLVKVDVEGAEWFVLRGMADTLAHHRPVVSLELHLDWQPPGVTTEQVEELLTAAGYQKKVITTHPILERQLWTARGSA
jgi:FkbM family methyltransferase